MKSLSLTVLSAALVTSCAMSPVLEPYNSREQSAGPTSQMATVWGDNTSKSFIMIKKVDGKRAPSRKGGGYPYSVTLTPGDHKLTIYLSELLGYMPYSPGSRYIDMTLDVSVKSGHQYAIRYNNTPNSSAASLYIVDLGENLNCKYVVTGKMQQGYVPVALTCE